MTRTALVLAAASLITAATVAAVHANPYSTWQKGDVKAIAAGKASGYQIKGCAHYEMRGPQAVQICDEYDAANYHKRFKEYGGTSPSK